jgi:carbon storage regulator
MVQAANRRAVRHLGVPCHRTERIRPSNPLSLKAASQREREGGQAKGRSHTMLVLSRQRDESIIIGDNVVVTIVDIRGDKVRLGIEAPKEVPVHRQEVYEAIRREAQKSRNDATDATAGDAK